MATRTPLILNQTTARIEELAAADSIPGYMLEGFTGKNFIINGDFRFWQRATTSAAAASRRYVADRWEVWSIGSTTQVDAMTINDGSIDPPVRFAHRVIVSTVAGAGNMALMRQHIEDVRTVSGKTVTYSVRLYSQAASQLAVNISQNFGSGGSAAVNVPAQKVSLVAGWQTVQLTFAVPSVSGKTIGTDSSLILQMWMDAGANYNSVTNSLDQRSGTYWFANAQLELGATATVFEYRPDALEVMLCQRYYQKSYLLDVAPGTVTNEGRFTYGNGVAVNNINRFVVPYHATMRKAPAVTVYGAPSGTAGVVSQADGSNVTAVVEAIGDSSFNIGWNNNAGKWGGWFQWSADAEL